MKMLNKPFCKYFSYICCMIRFASIIIMILAVVGQAASLLHVQSPWRGDPSYEKYGLHVIGSASASYIPDFSAKSKTEMTDEGDGWYSFSLGTSYQEWQRFDVVAAMLYDTLVNDTVRKYSKVLRWENLNDLSPQSMFLEDAERWIYTDPTDSTTFISLYGPDAKIVWFKSPWGIHTVPQMVVGKDSIRMHPADDPKKCGWFYGGISHDILSSNTKVVLSFSKYTDPQVRAASGKTLDITALASSKDTLFIDGSENNLVLASKISSLGECFDESKILHVFSPWRTDPNFKDSTLYISVDGSILINPTAMTADTIPRWYHYVFDKNVLQDDRWKSSEAKVHLYRQRNEWPVVSFFGDMDKAPSFSDFFPKGIYESWVYTHEDGHYDVFYNAPKPKVVRVLSPWTISATKFIISGDAIEMQPLYEYCGWFQGILYKPYSNFDGVIRQAHGTSFYGAEGLDSKKDIELGEVFANSDTVWISTSNTGGPKLFTDFPNVLGDCPLKYVSVQLFDWAGESFDDSEDVDFGNIYEGNPYTEMTFNGETYKACAGHVPGMVQDTLVNGAPARVDSMSFPWDQCTAAREIEKWYVPVELAVDASGRVYTNEFCRNIVLLLDGNGLWYANFSQGNGGCNDPENSGFYPLDNAKYLDANKTIKNPKFDEDSISGCKHNYSFSMKLLSSFTYVKGQKFYFRGDDDVWVFINNKLVVDLGGCHNPLEGSVLLDTLGLVEGKTYPFHIFMAERNATGSNFMMRTSINLSSEMACYTPETEKQTIVDGYRQMNLGDARIYGEHHSIVVESAGDGASLDVMDVQGRLLFKKRLDRKMTMISLPAGVYTVRIGNEIRSIRVK